MRTALHSAFVIHRRPYRETSLQIEVFSYDYGRLALIAKGANRPRSNLRAALHTFTPLLISWVARSDLGVLTAAELNGSQSSLEGRALWSAFYLNELLMRLLPRHDPHPALFDGYARALSELADLALAQGSVLRRFETLLLEQIGYGLLLNKDVAGAPIVATDDYCYQLERGPVRDHTASSNQSYVKGATLIALAKGEFPTASVERQAKHLMRYVLQHYLGDRPLQSRSLFHKAG